MNILSIFKNKRIVLALGMITVVAAILVSGTGAFFSDSETSTANTFTAGSIDLSLGSDFSSDNDNANGSGEFALASDNEGKALFTFTDLKPGDKGTVVFNMKVTSNDAYACALTDVFTNDENTIIDPEDEAGDSTPDGELQNYLQFATFADLDNNGEYNSGEPVNVNQYGSGDGNGFTNAEIGAAGWVPVADTTSPNTWLTTDKLVSGTEYGAGMLYCFGGFVTTGSGASTQVTGCNGAGNFNDAQTDSVTGGITFQSVQTRNNDGFTCASLVEDISNEDFENDLGDWAINSTGSLLELASSISPSDGQYAITNGDAFTHWGGYSSVFPVGGYTTEVDVYLDMALSTGGADDHFDFTSAINTPAGVHRRDFVFSVGLIQHFLENGLQQQVTMLVEETHILM